MAEHLTYCRICEPLCGMVATVEDGRLTSLRPDSEHPVTRGFSCPKGIEFVHVQNDPERLLHPLRRTPDGSFEQISWETATQEIGVRLRDIRRRHGGESIAWYVGNPAGFGHSHPMAVVLFLQGIGSPHLYSPSSQDTSSRFVASSLLYGSPLLFPLPDLERTQFLLMVGANPLVSRGSLLTAGNQRAKLSGIVARGGRVVVVDPRRTETARAYEHLFVRPDADAWLLLGLIHVVFAEGLADEGAIARQTRGVDSLREAAASCPPEAASKRCGVPPEEIRSLARAFAQASTAVAYGRTGACLGTRATLVNVLLDALNVVTGNLDRPGGCVFARSPIERAAKAGAGYDHHRSRVGDLPDVMGQLPAPLMAPEIKTPGPGQVRALVVSAGNPLLTVPGARELESALGELELQIGIDIYLNETHRHADYVLPATTMYERNDLPLLYLEAQLMPHVQWTEAVVPAYGEARDEWRIVRDLARELGFTPLSGALTQYVNADLLDADALRTVSESKGEVTPDVIVDAMLRMGRDGDRFGQQPSGLSRAKLREHPRGIVLAPHVETGVLSKRIRHQDARVHLDDPLITAELTALLSTPPPGAELPLLLIGQREIRSHNSWMHNTPKHRDSSRRQRALVNPADAAAADIEDGALMRVISADGQIELPARLSEDVAPGVVAVPHGWGHREAGWTTANLAGGANVNEITPGRPETLERLSGMAHLNGVPVRIEAVDPPATETPAETGQPVASARRAG